MATANFTVSRTRIAPVMAKVETTYGTDPTPAAGTDDVLTYDSPVPGGITSNRMEMRQHSSSFTRQTDFITSRFSTMRFKTMAQGSGTRGTATVNGFAGLGALMQACGVTQTVTAGTTGSVTWAPSTVGNLKSATVYANHHGYIHKMTGGLGNVVMSASSRSGIEMDFNLTGIYNAPAAVSTTFNSWTGGTKRAVPFLGLSTPLTINNGASYTANVFKSFRFDLGAQTEIIENCNDSTGVESIVMIDRNPTLQVVIAMDTYASAAVTYDEWWTDLFSSGPTTHAVSWKLGTTGSGNAFLFSFPTCQVVNVTPQANGGHREIVVDYKVQHTTAETEWLITID